MGGLIVESSYFDIFSEPDESGVKKLKDNKYHAVLEHVETVAYSWLGPFFFVELGSTVLIDESTVGVLGYALIFFVLLFIGQFLSASLAAKYVPGGFDWAESAMIGFGMMGRAELFFVVLDLCYNQHNIMTKDMFCCFAITAMLMNISVPVCISAYKNTFIKYSTEFGEDGKPLKQVDAEGGHGGHGDHGGHGGHDENDNDQKAEKPVGLADIDVSNVDNKVTK